MGAALLAVLGACTSTADPAPDAVASARLSMTASPTSASLPPSSAPAPSMLGTATLSPAQLQAFEEATATVLAYRQTIVDLYSGTRTNLNDLNLVAAGEMLEQNLQQIQSELGRGHRAWPEGFVLSLVSAELVTDRLGQRPATVTIRACVDATGLRFTASDGTDQSGVRERLDYSLTRTSYLAPPGWAVTRVQAGSDAEDRKC